MAPKISRQVRLKNKFQGVEMAMNNAVETNELKYTITSEKIQDIKTEMTKKEIPALYLYVGFFFRSIKIILSAVNKYLYSFRNEILRPIIKETTKTIFYTFQKIRESKEKREIALEMYLSKEETSKILEEEKTKSVERFRDQCVQNYEDSLSALFSCVTTATELNCEKKEFEKVSLSLEYDISLFELIYLKLSERKMLTNVLAVKINSVVDEKRVKNTIEFDLKKLGDRWSQVFSVAVASEVFNRIEFYKGKVEITHQLIPLKNQEKLFFQFCHHRLDLYMDRPIEEETTKTKTSYNTLKLDM